MPAQITVACYKVYGMKPICVRASEIDNMPSLDSGRLCIRAVDAGIVTAFHRL